MFLGYKTHLPSPEVAMATHWCVDISSLMSIWCHQSQTFLPAGLWLERQPSVHFHSVTKKPYKVTLHSAVDFMAETQPIKALQKSTLNISPLAQTSHHTTAHSPGSSLTSMGRCYSSSTSALWFLSPSKSSCPHWPLLVPWSPSRSLFQLPFSLDKQPSFQVNENIPSPCICIDLMSYSGLYGC